jgi:hypothetical protein
VPVAGGAVGCESGCLCALAPHGAGDCLPRHDPQSIALFSVASGWFRSQNRHCSWRPGATRAKGGQRRQKPDLGYIPATYFVSASLSMERVKGIEPSYRFLGVLHFFASVDFMTITFRPVQEAVVYNGSP